MKRKKGYIDFDDIVFENRNKDYGAYPLRKGYKRRFWFSLSMATAIMLLAAFLLNMAGKELLPPPPKPVKTIDVNLRQYQMPKLPRVKPPEETKSNDKSKEEFRSKADKAKSVPRVIKNAIPQNNTLPMKVIPLSVVTVDPVDGPELDAKPLIKLNSSPNMKEILAHIEDVTKEVSYTKVQLLPHYPGGDSAWYQYLRKNLNIGIVLRNRAMPAVYTAVIAFIVHPDSSLSDFKIVKDPGYGAGAEALRVVQKSGKWIPGTKNNKPVSFAQLQTVIFKVNN